ncbi:hypothetical protein [Fulvivirga ligni]|uniref:hypothetical protein n=1 Tax=Fulvivirga ligni TaxID=2904246 RepID=UPI001F4589CE|nr:hypothetical protein [Fulvivirga ligni]UII20734.1 hypothetical protein LVD16_23105 [Fulvivirga ligni]
MFKSKPFKFSVLLLLVVLVGYVGVQLYRQYQQRKYHRQDLVYELEHGLQFMDIYILDQCIITQKEVKTLFDDFLKVYTADDERLVQNLQTDITSKFFSVVPFNPLTNMAWKSAQQSQVLSQFSSWELQKLNEAYAEREKLLVLEEKLKMFSFHSPSFEHTFPSHPSKKDMEEMARKYELLFIQIYGQMKKTYWAYEQALEELNPENAYLHYQDSVKKQQLTPPQYSVH